MNLLYFISLGFAYKDSMSQTKMLFLMIGVIWCFISFWGECRQKNFT